MIKEIFVDNLICVKLVKKSNNLKYYLAKVPTAIYLESLGYEVLTGQRVKSKLTKEIFNIKQVLKDYDNQEYVITPILNRRLAGKSCWFTQDEFDWCYGKENFDIVNCENDTYDIEVFKKAIYNYVPDSLKKLYVAMDKLQDVVWDIETTGLDRHRDNITSVQFSWIGKDGKEYQSFIEWDSFSIEDWRTLFKNLAKHKLVAHNGKFDSLFIYQKLGKDVQLPLTDDTIVMSHCTDNEHYGLKDNVLKWFNHDYDIKLSKKTGTVSKDLILYGLLDVIYTRKLKNKLEPRLDKWNTRQVYNYELRAYRAYYKVEQVGVPISPRIDDIQSQLEEDAKVIEKRLLKQAKINWGSNKQVATVMFSPKDEPIYSEEKKRKWVTSVLTGDVEYKTKKEATEVLKAKGYKPKDMGLLAHVETVQEVLGFGLGLKPKGKTSSGNYAVGKDVLAEYSDNSVIADLIAWKALVKLKQFPDSWKELAVDNRIYPSFNLTARTGRTTCSTPNIQQCPQGSSVRNLIEARDGWKIMECFSGDTEVLTEKGWQRLDNLDKSFKVAQYDMDSREVTFDNPIQYIHHKDKETFCYEDRNTSLCATANHNMLTTWGKGYKVTKHKFKDVRFSRGNAFINAGFYNNGVSDEFKTRYIAMFTADGSKSKEGYVTFSFSKIEKAKRCEFILNTLGIKFSLNKYIRQNGVLNYSLYVGKHSNHLLKGYVDRDKKLTINCVHELDLEAFLDEIQYWDATYTRAKDNKSIRFVTCVKETAEIVQMMCVLRGKKTTIRTYNPKVKASNDKHSLVYYLNYKINNNDPHTFMGNKVVDFTKPIIQDAYCVTMPKGTIMIRHNGKVSIQGNCDYSQAELRVASMFAKDANMQHAYNSGSDLHNMTTHLLFGDTSQLSHDEQKRKRTQAKSCNFGYLYGMGSNTFVDYAKSYGLNLTKKESADIRESFFEAYPRLPKWHEECKAFVHKHGYSYSPTGRKRFFPDINSTDKAKVAASERACVNAGVQGFASDLCVGALADVVFNDELDHSKFNVIASVHDAILIEVKEDYAKELGAKVQKIMERPSFLDDLNIQIPVPLVADLTIGQSWGMEE